MSWTALQRSRGWWAAVGAILLAGLARRAWHVGEASLWLDETTSGLFARGTLANIFRHVLSEVHPPTYYLLLWGWAQAFGTSEVGLRSLSVVAGSAAIVAVAVLGHRLASRQVGLVAAGLLAVNAFAIVHSRQARSYALLLLFTTVLLLCYWLWSEERPDFAEATRRRRRLLAVAFVLSALAVLALHLNGIFVVAAVGLHRLVRHRMGLPIGEWRRTLLAFGAIAAGFLPWAVVLQAQVRRTVGHDFLGLPQPGFIDLWVALRSLAGANLVAAIVVVAAALGGLLVLARPRSDASASTVAGTVGASATPQPQVPADARIRSRSAAWLLGLVLGLTVLVPFVISQFGTSIFVVRYFIAALVPLVVLAALGLSRLASAVAAALPKPTGIGWTAVALVLVVSVPGYGDPDEDWRSASAYLDATADGPILVYRSFMWQPIAFYSARPDATVYGIRDAVGPLSVPDGSAADVAPPTLESFLHNTTTTFWLVLSHTRGDEAWVLETVDTRFHAVQELESPGIRILRYEPRAPAAPGPTGDPA